MYQYVSNKYVDLKPRSFIRLHIQPKWRIEDKQWWANLDKLHIFQIYSQGKHSHLKLSQIQISQPSGLGCVIATSFGWYSLFRWTNMTAIWGEGGLCWIILEECANKNCQIHGQYESTILCFSYVSWVLFFGLINPLHSLVNKDPSKTAL